MTDIPPFSTTPEVGTLSPDGSRIWTGRFWAVTNPVAPPADYEEAIALPLIIEAPLVRRGIHLGGVIVASVFVVVWMHFSITLPGFLFPSSASLTDVLRAEAIGLEVWSLLLFIFPVVALSVGRQAIDVLLLRAMFVGMVFGLRFGFAFPLFFITAGQQLEFFAKLAFYGAIVLGPIFWVLATVLNLIWYRSFRGLRPQLLDLVRRGSRP